MSAWAWPAIPAALNGPVHAGLRILAIAVAAMLAQLALSRAIRTVRARVAARMADAERVRRAETLGRVLRYTSAVIITAVAAILVLGELGVSLAPFLGAAGIVGLAIGFGAQSLVKDYFSGVLMLIEGQVAKGDIVQVAGLGGVVEDITLRYLQLRDYDGHVHYVPNGQITTVSNLTRVFAYAVVDVGVAYREDVDEAAALVRRTAAALADDPAFAAALLGDFEYAGVERLDESAVVLRGRFKVRPMEQWNVRREFLRRIKAAFDTAGLEIPFPHLTFYAGANRDGSASPLQVAAQLQVQGKEQNERRS
jgi:small-conductance mechanosensitive channel